MHKRYEVAYLHIEMLPVLLPIFKCFLSKQAQSIYNDTSHKEFLRASGNFINCINKATVKKRGLHPKSKIFLQRQARSAP